HRATDLAKATQLIREPIHRVAADLHQAGAAPIAADARTADRGTASSWSVSIWRLTGTRANVRAELAVGSTLDESVDRELSRLGVHHQLEPIGKKRLNPQQHLGRRRRRRRFDDRFDVESLRPRPIWTANDLVVLNSVGAVDQRAQRLVCQPDP